MASLVFAGMIKTTLCIPVLWIVDATVGFPAGKPEPTFHDVICGKPMQFAVIARYPVILIQDIEQK